MGFFGLVGFALVENTQEENPCDFGDVLHRAGNVGTAHDVADGSDGVVDCLRGSELLSVVDHVDFVQLLRNL